MARAYSPAPDDREDHEGGTNLLFDELSKPISAESACGPDLDLEFDPDFMNFLARAEGMLPGQFFTRDQDNERERPFERGSLNFQPEIATARALLARSRDIRLLVVLAKFAILDRKLAEFVEIVETISGLLDQRWDDINPRAEEGDFSFRMAALLALDDMTHIVLPLQFTPLIRHPRAGVITFRNKLVADGLQPRDGEETLEAGDIERAFQDIDIAQLTELRDWIARLVAATESIGAVTIDRLGHSKSAQLDLLQGLARKILDFVDGFVQSRNPAAPAPADDDAESPAETPGAGAPAAPKPGAIAGLEDVAAALAGVAGYYGRAEPSSPALLLVRQAQQLVGRNFIDVMRILMPEFLDQATIGVGKGQTFDLPIQRLSDQMGPDDEAPPPCPADAAEIPDRAAALAKLSQIEAYYSRSEPTSPVPFLCERARKLSSVDFLTILKEILPEHALKSQT